MKCLLFLTVFIQGQMFLWRTEPVEVPIPYSVGGRVVEAPQNAVEPPLSTSLQ